MRPRPSHLLVALALLGCQGELGAGPAGPRGPRDPRDPTELAIQPSSVRRLARHEYDHSVADLLGFETDASDGFAGDARVAGYTASAALRVDATLGEQLRTAAEAIATTAVTEHLATVVPCDRSAADCPRTFVTTLATRAFRRPATDLEIEGLLAIFTLASTNGGTFEEGVSAVLQAVLQSASFLYVPQIGAGDDLDRTLDAYETASALSYFLTASPPDAALLEAAAADSLRTPDQREAQARRLLDEHPRARAQVVRFVQEWLGLDTLHYVARDSETHDFTSLRPLMEEETRRFVEDVVFAGDGTFESLIAADFTLANGTLRDFYGLEVTSDDWSRAELEGTPRRGLLGQASFLATHAARDESSPVKRGVTILRRILCLDVPAPTGDVAEQAMMTPPPARTTRERFTQHSTNPVCAGCHSLIDPLGFAFEDFDQLGAFRTEENGTPVDSSGELVGTDVNGPFADGGELVAMLAESPQAHACFARNLFRFASARSSQPLEASFLDAWGRMPDERRSSLVEIWIELVRSELFVQRRAVP
ncbi:DUF1592 domain-containing protein [Sandaracinus amylolyticus]|uniref:DUF1592 domain-containing protein n=1 Tax=Sandaracinus amylolyticus TaxID=927083 RepID=UPI001F21BCB9|nr:DUF1592 domain-containing protein [Sandaracinus amylolyticus]UJR83274.1 Hypothetical protein I5071_53410 [Sandaracinus amylolyticus]